jgi:D-serine deaminase-like pyridoxal phosphate-dependent protein
MEDLRLAADHPGNVDALAAVLQGAARPLPVLVDIDPGIRRTGVASAASAVALAQRIAQHPQLTYAGVQFYCGAQQHIESFADRRAAIEERTLYLQNVIAALTAAGFAPGMITGGGTGTHAIDAALGVFNELQVGSYVFMDRQYRDCDLAGAGADRPPFESALFIDAHVISANAQSMATLDAGFKALSTDGGTPQIVSGAPESAMFVFMGDEHGALIAPDHTFQLGDRVTLTAPHCDPTVNLYDAYQVVRGDTLIDIWPVTARGRSR